MKPDLAWRNVCIIHFAQRRGLAPAKIDAVEPITVPYGFRVRNVHSSVSNWQKVPASRNVKQAVRGENSPINKHPIHANRYRKLRPCKRGPFQNGNSFAEGEPDTATVILSN